MHYHAMLETAAATINDLKGELLMRGWELDHARAVIEELKGEKRAREGQPVRVEVHIFESEEEPEPRRERRTDYEMLLDQTRRFKLHKK